MKNKSIKNIWLNSLFQDLEIHSRQISRKWQCSAEVWNLRFVLSKILRLEIEPQLSLRRLSQLTEPSVSTCQRIVRKDLDYNKRLAYRNFINNDETVSRTSWAG
jgi:hypothetical protein